MFEEEKRTCPKCDSKEVKNIISRIFKNDDYPPEVYDDFKCSKCGYMWGESPKVLDRGFDVVQKNDDAWNKKLWSK